MSPCTKVHTRKEVNEMTEVEYKRRVAKLTQQELAEKAGINANTVSTIEKNGIENVKVCTLRKLAAALECDLTELF